MENDCIAACRFATHLTSPHTGERGLFRTLKVVPALSHNGLHTCNLYWRHYYKSSAWAGNLQHAWCHCEHDVTPHLHCYHAMTSLLSIRHQWRISLCC